MTLRAWKALGLSAVLAGGVGELVAGDKPADLPVRPEVTGRVLPAINRDLHQPEPVKPAGNGINSRNFSGNVIGLQAPRQPTPDLDVPIRTTSFGPRFLPHEEGDTVDDRKARLAFETAETHRTACELSEAERWYRETIRQAPRSTFAGTAAERLKNLRTVQFTPQSAEPPLAETSRNSRSSSSASGKQLGSIAMRSRGRRGPDYQCASLSTVRRK